MPRRPLPWPELVAALALGLGAAGFLVDSLSLPPPRFDPLGPAALPRWLAALVILLAAAIALGALLSPPPVPAEPAPPERRGLALATFALTLLYVALLASRRVGYAELTLAFVLATGLLLGGPRPRPMLAALALGLLLGYGGAHVFTRILFIDLP